MSYYLHRTLCDTLQEARQVLSGVSIWNYRQSTAILRSLVEEAQIYGNRMEAGLSYGKDLNRLHKQRKRAIEDLKILQEALPEDLREKHEGMSTMASIADILGEDE